MIVVADTSPLNYLVRLGCPQILLQMYGDVVVPLAVLSELLHPRAPAEVRAWAAAPPSWLKHLEIRELDESLASALGAGEREAISLALELRADVLLIDEIAGRREALVRQLAVAGTLAVLLQASLRGYVDLAKAVEDLRFFGFRVSANVEAAVTEQFKRLREGNT